MAAGSDKHTPRLERFRGSLLPQKFFSSRSLVVLAGFLFSLAGAIADENPATAIDYLDTARSKISQGLFFEAEQLYQKALNLAVPSVRPRCLDGLITLNSQLGQHQKAISYARELLKVLNDQKDVSQKREVYLHLGESYLALNHLKDAEQSIEKAQATSEDQGYDLETQVKALVLLAKIASKKGDLARVEQISLELDKLLTPEKLSRMSLANQIKLGWKRADVYRQAGQVNRAIDCLTNLLPLHDRQKDKNGMRKSLQMLAELFKSKKEIEQYHKAEKVLLQAMSLNGGSAEEERLGNAHLSVLLSEIYRLMDRDEDVRKTQNQALQLYQQALLREPWPEQMTMARRTRAFWELFQLCQKMGQIDKSMQLMEYGNQNWWREGWSLTNLKAETGKLYLQTADYEKAWKNLKDTVELMENQEPKDLVDLPKALVTLGNVELYIKDKINTSKAEGDRAQDCINLYKKYQLPRDATLAEAYYLHGFNLFSQSKYARAIKSFEDGVQCCELLAHQGTPANLQHRNLLLNISHIQRRQGELDRALNTCKRAEELYKNNSDFDPFEMVAVQAELADLYSGQGKYQDADRMAGAVLGTLHEFLDRQKKQGNNTEVDELELNSIRVTALHCQALYLLSKRDYQAAKEKWESVLKLQNKGSTRLLRSRTYNYLGITSEREHRFDQAEEYYQKALQGSPQENTRFISLWRLTYLAKKKNDVKSAKSFMDRAVKVVEDVRLQTYGDPQQRATFFAQFDLAFDQMVDWSVELGLKDEAFTYAARTRSRTFLDQMQLGGVDPLETLHGEEGDKLRQLLLQNRKKYADVRTRLQLLSIEMETQSNKKIEAELKEVSQEQANLEKEYGLLFTQIQNNNPFYRNLKAFDRPEELLAALRTRVIKPGNLLLVYHLGREKSYLFILGDNSQPLEIIKLTVSGKLLNEMAAITASDGKEATRGFVLTKKQGTPNPPEIPSAVSKFPDEVLPLTRERAQVLLNPYRSLLGSNSAESKMLLSTRGFEIKGPDLNPATVNRVNQALANMGEVFVPAHVRQRIQNHYHPEQVMVVPDGTLHKIPLEALPIEIASKKSYLLEELPPLIYSPSCMVLALQTERMEEKPIPGSILDGTLLTVSNPAYPVAKIDRTTKNPMSSNPEDPENINYKNSETVVVKRGDDIDKMVYGTLPLLPNTAEESKRIQALWHGKKVVALERLDATEGRVRQEMKNNPRIIHLAVHGIADMADGNLFGALALTPPAPNSSSSDEADTGFLFLKDISMLNLEGCELAVLSACNTNVGPQRPLEAGITLAGAFLTAGTRQVVASHWSVADASTAELMSRFFEEGLKQTSPQNWAKALHQARLKIKNNPKNNWSSPYYWSPFVIVGPPPLLNSSTIQPKN